MAGDEVGGVVATYAIDALDPLKDIAVCGPSDGIEVGKGAIEVVATNHDIMVW